MTRKSPTTTYISAAELARQYKMDPRTVVAILRRAGLRSGPHGYSKADADFAVVLFDETAERAGHAANGRGALSETAEAKQAIETKRRFEDAKTKKIEIENDTKLGKLIERDKAVRDGALVVAAAREAFLSIGRAAHKIVNQVDELKIAHVLEDEARSILTELADGLAKAAA